MGIVGNSRKSSAYYTLDLLVYGLEFIATPCCVCDLEFTTLNSLTNVRGARPLCPLPLCPSPHTPLNMSMLPHV